MSGRTPCLPAWCGTASSHSFACRSPWSPHAATTSCCAPRRRSAAAWCSTPLRRRRLERTWLEALDQGAPADIVRLLVTEPSTAAELQARGVLTPAELTQALSSLQSAGEYYFSDAWLSGLRQGVHARLADRAAASPLDPGLPLAELLPPKPWALVRPAPARGRAPRRRRRISPERRRRSANKPRRLPSSRRNSRGRRSRSSTTGSSGHFSKRRAGSASSATATRCRPRCTSTAVQLLPTLEPITLAAFRDAVGVGRRTAQLLLERYDADGLTLRRGDVRTLRRQR